MKQELDSDKSRKIESEQIFNCALEFDYSQQLLLREFGKNEFETLSPLVSMQVFTLELYFKCLLHIISGNLKKTHELKRLYDTLPVKDQTAITKSFNQDLHISRIRQSRKTLTKKYPLRKQDSYKITDILTDANEAYQKFRYSFEKNTGVVRGMYPIIDSVRERIFEYKPEWRNKPIPSNHVSYKF